MANANLWAQAAASLSPSDKLPIDLSDPTISQSVDDVLRCALQKQEECRKKLWKYKNKKGEEVILRDVFGKIVAWVEKFKAVGDTIVQYDPGHFALPWAAVRFVLQIVVNDQKDFGAMAEGIEMVSNLITRCRVVEQLYLKKASEIQQQLTDALLALYKDVLIYLGRAGRYYGHNTAARLLKSTVSSPEKYINPIAEKQALVDRCTRLIGAEVLEKASGGVEDISSKLDRLEIKNQETQSQLISILKDLDKPINRVAAQVSDLHNALNEDERYKFFDWLSAVQYAKHHRARSKILLPGSCRWLFQRQVYQDWITSSVSSTLWLHGIPGSGKSMLTCSCIETFISTNSKSNPISGPLFAYFYCSRDTAEPERSDPDHVMQSILEQLSSSDIDAPIRQPVLRAYLEHKREARGRRPERLTLEECTEIILQLLETDPAVIIIDAMDECDPLQRQDLLLALKRIVRESDSVVKIFISSRDDKDIVKRMATSSDVYIKAADNTNDIEDFTRYQVARAIDEGKILGGDISQRLRDHITETLLSKANGMFRLVSSHIQSLCNPRRIKTESNVLSALVTLPQELDETYAIIMDQISTQESPNPEIALCALRWLSCARRQLKVTEFLTAVGVDPRGKHLNLSPASLLDICCNFIVYESVQDTFRFAHLSVREYLENSGLCVSGISNAHALHRCLDISFGLTKTMTMSKPAMSHNKALSNYANAYWPQHYRATSSIHIDDDIELGSELQRKLERFWNVSCHDDNFFTLWLINPRNFRKFSMGIKEVKSLFEKLGLSVFKENQKTDDIKSTVTNGKLLYTMIQRPAHSEPSLLHLAAADGDLPMVKWLVRSGANVNLRNGRQETPLTLAILNGSFEVTSLLLEHGADAVNRVKDETEFLRAVQSNKPELVAEILKFEAKRDALERNDGGTYINAAVAVGSLPIAKLLLDVKGLVRQYHLSTALEKTRTAKDTSIRRLLLNRVEILAEEKRVAEEIAERIRRKSEHLRLKRVAQHLSWHYEWFKSIDLMCLDNLSNVYIVSQTPNPNLETPFSRKLVNGCFYQNVQTFIMRLLTADVWQKDLDWNETKWSFANDLEVAFSSRFPLRDLLRLKFTDQSGDWPLDSNQVLLAIRLCLGRWATTTGARGHVSIQVQHHTAEHNDERMTTLGIFFKQNSGVFGQAAIRQSEKVLVFLLRLGPSSQFTAYTQELAVACSAPNLEWFEDHSKEAMNLLIYLLPMLLRVPENFV